MLSDTDIRIELQQKKGINIDPFEEDCLTPVGYDLRVGAKGFSWKHQCIFEINDKNPLKIEPDDTLVIETYESVQLSKQVGATIHAMATQVIRRGLSHISTTVDPGWTGRILISIHNYRNTTIELEFKEKFCTVCFYKMQTEAQKDVLRPPGRSDIWSELSDKARDVRNRQSTVRQNRDNREYGIRVMLVVAFILVVSVIGIQLSLKDPALGASLATFLAVVSPTIIDLLKPK